MPIAAQGPLVDILLPVYNEEHVLEKSVTALRQYLQEHQVPFRWVISIGDNASIDRTLQVAEGLATRFADVRVVHLPRKGRGRMVKHAWKESPADIVTYMDIDLSTDLGAFAPMVQAIVDGYDFAIGSRQYRGAYVERSLKREVISRGYIVILKLLLRFPFTDAQCGFKAASRKSFLELLPLIEDDEWFFDTELLHLAARRGYRVKELPVRWIEDLDSRVRIARTMWLDLKGVWRMMHSPHVRKKNIPPR
ncbi:MAG TPA: glycosyltransferase [Candidatus Aminicenantes bacterium]|nr:glycosyltransferase [Candidatus Aminicenantes bacterium]